MRLCLAIVLLLIAVVPRVSASADADEERVQLDLSTASIGGTLILPRHGRPSPCVVIVGGSLSQGRDGELARARAPKRTALKRLAESLAGGGYGSFRYDQVGHGSSRAKPAWTDLYAGDARILAEIYSYLRTRSECTKVVAAAESAGAYVASLAARAGAHADAYLLLGGFCGKAQEIFAYNYGRFARYVDQSAENAAWARRNHLDRELALGRHWREIFAAARAGKKDFGVVEGNFRQMIPLARRREELENPPDEMFAYIKNPALALAGTRDLNVAPHHAACEVAVIQRAGNLRARSVLIDGADHNFQIAPDDPDLAFRERYTLASFHRPYHPQLDREILSWLHEVAPASGHRHQSSAAPRPPDLTDFYSHAVQAPEIEPRTDTSPERLHLAPGLTIIEDITDRRKTVGVDTLEGFIGPLLRTPEMRAHFIDMPGGMYLDEHPHSKGSIIYTVGGTWALESLGRWHLMKPGSLYWFGDNIPTGYQVPFRERAYILIFKAISGDPDGAFMNYLKGMAARLRSEAESGTAFELRRLPPSHPALEFARRVNPRFDQDFPARTK